MNIYRKNLTIMCGITFLTGLIFYGSIATIIRQHRGLSIYEIFILESIFTIAMLLFEIPWGYFADKFGYKKTLITSYILFLLSKIIFYKAYGFYLFLLEAIISSMALAGISGCDSALIYLSIGDKYSEKAFSKYNASNVAGFFIASLLSTFIIRISLDAIIFYTILSYTLALVLVFFIEDVDYDKKDVSIRNSFYTLISNKNIVPFIVSMALISEATHSICIFLNQPKYLMVGINIKNFGFLTALMQIICLISVRAYVISEKLGKKRSFIILIVSITVSCFLLAYVTSKIICIFLIVLIEASFAICQPLSLDVQNKSIFTKDRATILSMYAMITDIISSMTNAIVGKTATISLKYSFILCGLLSLLSLLFVVIYFHSINKNINIKKALIK